MAKPTTNFADTGGELPAGISQESFPMPDAPATEEEQVARVAGVHRIYAHLGARKTGLSVEEIHADLVANFLIMLHHFDPSRGSIVTFARWQARGVLASKHYRRWRRQHVLAPTAPELTRLTEDEEEPATIAETNELIELLGKRLQALPQKHRKAIDLYFGLTSGVPLVGAELAAAYGRTFAAARFVIRDGLSRLAEALGADPENAAMSRRAAAGMQAQRK